MTARGPLDWRKSGQALEAELAFAEGSQRMSITQPEICYSQNSLEVNGRNYGEGGGAGSWGMTRNYTLLWLDGLMGLPVAGQSQGNATPVPP